MKKYIVKFENREMWNTEEDIHDESKWIVSEEDISRLAIEWGKDIAELMEQVEEKEEMKMTAYEIYEG